MPFKILRALFASCHSQSQLCAGLLTPHLTERSATDRRPARRPLPRSRRLICEMLEDRTLLASILVTDTAAELYNDPTVTVGTLGANVSLRDAINAANNTEGADTIVLQDTTYQMFAIDNYWYGPN